MDVDSKVLGQGGTGPTEDAGGDQRIKGAVSSDPSFIWRTLCSRVVTETPVKLLKPQRRLVGLLRTLFATRFLKQVRAEVERSNPMEWRHHNHHSRWNNHLVRSPIFLPHQSETPSCVFLLLVVLWRLMTPLMNTDTPNSISQHNSQQGTPQPKSTPHHYSH